MRPIDIPTLVDWLGLEGAVAGLERSILTNADLMVLARQNGISANQKLTRRQLSIELVMSPVKRIDKTEDFLLNMSATELKQYFQDIMVSNAELSSLLKRLGIEPPGTIRGRLSDYAAREISELGMYQRVAKGHQGNS